MDKGIEKHIKSAMPLMEKYEAKLISDYKNKLASGIKVKESEKYIDKEFKGYISSFCASIIMSGLVPAIVFFSSEKNAAQSDRWQIIEWIWDIIKKERGLPAGGDLLSYTIDHKTDKQLQKNILDIAVAIKLCIRTFELTK